MVELVRAAGADVRKISGGTSYRSGGVMVVHPLGYWDQPVPVRVETAPRGRGTELVTTAGAVIGTSSGWCRMRPGWSR